VQFDLAATSELFPAKRRRLPKNEINLPACVQVDDVKQRFASICLKRRIEFGVVVLAVQIGDKDFHFPRRCRYDKVEILSRARGTLASAGKGADQHVLDASMLKGCSDPKKNFCDAHLRPAGRGLGRKAILNSSR